jgi:hypothetical protein
MDNQEFERRQEEILKDIPEEFRSAVRWHAYDSGHASGRAEVLYHVQDLVDMLKEPIAKYTARLANSS